MAISDDGGDAIPTMAGFRVHWWCNPSQLLKTNYKGPKDFVSTLRYGYALATTSNAAIVHYEQFSILRIITVNIP